MVKYSLQVEYYTAIKIMTTGKMTNCSWQLYINSTKNQNIAFSLYHDYRYLKSKYAKQNKNSFKLEPEDISTSGY